MRTREHRKADGSDILIDGSGGNGLRSLEQAGVNHFVPGIAQHACDDLDAAIVAIKADLGDEYAFASHQITGTST